MFEIIIPLTFMSGSLSDSPFDMVSVSPLFWSKIGHCVFAVTRDLLIDSVINYSVIVARPLCSVYRSDILLNKEFFK